MYFSGQLTGTPHMAMIMKKRLDTKCMSVVIWALFSHSAIWSTYLDYHELSHFSYLLGALADTLLDEAVRQFGQHWGFPSPLPSRGWMRTLGKANFFSNKKQLDLLCTKEKSVTRNMTSPSPEPRDQHLAHVSSGHCILNYVLISCLKVI